MEEHETQDKKLVKEILEKAKEAAHLENIAMDDHGDAIVGNRLSAPNFSLEEKEKKQKKQKKER